jgi:hypothetical protein
MDTDTYRKNRRDLKYKDFDPKINTKFLTKDDMIFEKTHNLDKHPLLMFMLDLDEKGGFVEVSFNPSIYNNQFYLLSDADTLVDFYEMRKANKKILAARVNEQKILNDLLVKSQEVVYMLSNFQYDAEKKGVVKGEPGAKSLELLENMALALYHHYKNDSQSLEAETSALWNSIEMEDHTLISRLHTMIDTLFSLIHGIDETKKMSEFFDKNQ